jgi:multiple sugar transport system ATP-binding protein
VFTAQVDVLESMGSDKFAYFSMEGEQAMSDDLADLAADAGTADVPGGDSGTLVTRLSATSGVREGERAEVWVDTGKIQVFDPSSGKNLTSGTGTAQQAASAATRRSGRPGHCPGSVRSRSTTSSSQRCVRIRR